jgi:hypothetical protein
MTLHVYAAAAAITHLVHTISFQYGCNEALPWPCEADAEAFARSLRCVSLIVTVLKNGKERTRALITRLIDLR